MVEIMGRLPVVEDFITILDRGVRCRKQINSEESIKGSDRIDQRLICRFPQCAGVLVALADVLWIVRGELHTLGLQQ